MRWKDLRSEIHAHIEEKALYLIESGVPEREAWEQARREFGNATLAIESSREVWVWTWFESLAQDVRYALRAMASNWLFTLLAMTSLALGIGANTAIFSFMDAILLRSLPVKNPESLVLLKFQRPGVDKGQTRGSGSDGTMSVHITSGGSYDGSYSVFPYPAFEVFHARSDLFTSLFGYHGQPETRLIVNRQATLGDCVYVSGEFFGGLAVAPNRGRALTGDDDRFGSSPVAMVSPGFAQQWYGSSNDALGKIVGVNGVSFTVVGITPPGFFGVNPEWSS